MKFEAVPRINEMNHCIDYGQYPNYTQQLQQYIYPYTDALTTKTHCDHCTCLTCTQTKATKCPCCGGYNPGQTAKITMEIKAC